MPGYTDYYGFLTDVQDGTDVLPASDWIKLTKTLDRVLVKLAGLFGAGFFGPEDFALVAVTGQAALTVNPGGAFVEKGAGGGLVLASSAAPQLFSDLDPGDVEVWVDTEGTAHVVAAGDPAPIDARLAGTATVGDGAITAVDNLPAGRINLVGASCVRADSDDQQAGTLADKLAVGSGLTLTVEGSGAARHLLLDLAPTSPQEDSDEKVKLDAADTAAYLKDKLAAGPGVSVTEKTVNGVRLLELAATGGAGGGELVKVDAADVAGYLGTKLAAGTNINLVTVTDTATGEKAIRISATSGGGEGGLDTQTVEDSLPLSMSVGDELEVVWDHAGTVTFAIPLFTMAWVKTTTYTPLTGIRITPLHQSKQGDVTNEHQAVMLVQRLS